MKTVNVLYGIAILCCLASCSVDSKKSPVEKTVSNWTKQSTINPEIQTFVVSDNTEYDYGNIQKGSKNDTTFFLKNTGKAPLIIHQVSASCECISVEWDKQPTDPGCRTKIKVIITANETGYFNKTVEIFGNFVESPVKLTITGMAIE